MPDPHDNLHFQTLLKTFAKAGKQFELECKKTSRFNYSRGAYKYSFEKWVDNNRKAISRKSSLSAESISYFITEFLARELRNLANHPDVLSDTAQLKRLQRAVVAYQRANENLRRLVGEDRVFAALLRSPYNQTNTIGLLSQMSLLGYTSSNEEALDHLVGKKAQISLTTLMRAIIIARLWLDPAIFVRKRGGPAVRWRREFVLMIARLWRELSDRPLPKGPTTAFASLVEEIWNSILEASGRGQKLTLSWARTIRDTVADIELKKIQLEQ